MFVSRKKDFWKAFSTTLWSQQQLPFIDNEKIYKIKSQNPALCCSGLWDHYSEN
jgi:hypothetical protein